MLVHIERNRDALREITLHKFILTLTFTLEDVLCESACDFNQSTYRFLYIDV